MTIKFFLLSLGCAKNLVNSEQMIALLKADGMKMTENANDADVAIVNTCGFIDSAKSEAIEAILELAQLKTTGKLRALVVSGCLTQRYQKDVMAQMPEIDAVLGTGSYTDIVSAVHGALGGKEPREYFAPMESAALNGERQILTPSYSAYLRIAEGCDNRCAYCIIPFLRGAFRSRPMEELLAEAQKLADGGVRELMIIAQDITRYGTDIYGKHALAELLEKLCKIEGIKWLRLHYMYPDEIEDELLLTIKNNDKILKYFDIPIQHVNDRVLSDMNRRGNGALIRERFDKIRALMPDAVFRTSLIVGFPGETDEEFNELYDFLSIYRLERAGVFCYSQEEGTKAAEMQNQISEEVKEERRAAIYQLQEGIMDECSERYNGKCMTVLCCGQDESGRLTARSYMDAPDIDGVVYIDGGNAKAGDFVTVKITGHEGCDLFATLVK